MSGSAFGPTRSVGLDAISCNGLRDGIAVPVYRPVYLALLEKAGEVLVVVAESFSRFSSRYVLPHLLVDRFGELHRNILSVQLAVRGWESHVDLNGHTLLGGEHDAGVPVGVCADDQRLLAGDLVGGVALHVVSCPLVSLRYLLHLRFLSFVYLTYASILAVLGNVKSVCGVLPEKGVA